MSRNIAINKASLGAVVTAGVGAAVAFGFLPAADNDAVVTAVNAVVAGGFSLVAAVQVVVGLLIHRNVTPVADPRLGSGEALVPASLVNPDTFEGVSTGAVSSYADIPTVS